MSRGIQIDGRGAAVAGRAVAPTVDAIPDSEADQKLSHRWLLSEDSTPFADSEGSADSSQVTGTTQVTGDYADGAAREGDGSNDAILFPIDPFGSLLDTDFAVALTIDGLTSSSLRAIGVSSTGSSGNMEFSVFFNRNNAGDVGLNLSDADNNNLLITTSSGGHVDDGGPHRIVLNKLSNSGSGAIDIYIDQTEIPTSVDLDQGFSNVEDFTHGWAVLARNNSGSPDLNMSAINDDVCLFDDSLTSSEATSYDNPWN